jgi:hypothetical protein
MHTMVRKRAWLHEKRLRSACTRSCTPSPALDAVVKEGRALSEDASATRAGRRVFVSPRTSRIPLQAEARRGSGRACRHRAGTAKRAHSGRTGQCEWATPGSAQTGTGQGSSSLETTNSPFSRPHRRPPGGPSRPAAEIVCTIVCMHFAGAFRVAKRFCAPLCASMNGVDAMHVRRRGMRALALERPPVAR